MHINVRALLISLTCLGVIVGGVWFFFLRDTRPVNDPAGITAAGVPTGVVLIVPGHGGSQDSVRPLSEALNRAGWRTEILDIGTGTGDINVNSEKVVTEAKRLSDTGNIVSLIGYSEGGLIVRRAIQLGAAPYVSRVVTVATPHDGTKIAELGVIMKSPECQEACRQMVPGSEFLSSLPKAGDATRWLSIYSTSDDVIRPYESSVLTGATMLPIQDICPASVLNHGGIIRDATVAAETSTFLSTGRISSTCLN